MKRQQAEAVLNRFLEECGDTVPAQSDIEPVLDRVWERLEWKVDEFADARIPATPARPFRFAWAAGIVLVAVLVNALVWRQGPPFSVAVRTGNADEHSLLKSSSQQAGDGLQLTVPQEVFELASVKLLAPSSDAVKTANQFSELQLMSQGCTSGYTGGTRVDPGRLIMPAVTVTTLVIVAYGQDCTLVEGGPAWAQSGEYYEINALLPRGTPNYTVQDLTKGDAPVLQRMLQDLLKDRFRLVLKRELREVPVYALTVATPGKMKLSADETVPAPLMSPPPGLPMLGPLPPLGRGQNVYFILPGEARMSGHAISGAELAKTLRPRAGRIVVDKTGFTGLFDYDLKFAFETAPSTLPAAPPSPQSIPPLPGTPLPLPSLAGALEDQLGLKLESARMPIEVLIIERVERPSEN